MIQLNYFEYFDFFQTVMQLKFGFIFDMALVYQKVNLFYPVLSHTNIQFKSFEIQVIHKIQVFYLLRLKKRFIRILSNSFLSSSFEWNTESYIKHHSDTTKIFLTEVCFSISSLIKKNCPKKINLFQKNQFVSNNVVCHKR